MWRRPCPAWARPVRRIREGRIEGGDICLARRGLLILGISGERTDEAGAMPLRSPLPPMAGTFSATPSIRISSI